MVKWPLVRLPRSAVVFGWLAIVAVGPLWDPKGVVRSYQCDGSFPIHMQLGHKMRIGAWSPPTAGEWKCQGVICGVPIHGQMDCPKSQGQNGELGLD